ncbi:MAG TPA: hypothetical protein DCM62_03685 [Bacteroidales bacterium]|nr:hypothetical protein [Bacteroidales bacterium]
MNHLIFLCVFLFISSVSLGNNTESLNYRLGQDTDQKAEPAQLLFFSPAKASEFLRQLVQNDAAWASADDSLRTAIRRLLDQYTEPYRTVKARLQELDPLDGKLEAIEIVKHDTLPLRWIAPQTFIVDTVALTESPVIRQLTIVRRAVDPTAIQQLRYAPNLNFLLDNYLQVVDTIAENIINRKYLDARKITVHRIENGRIVPPLLPSGSATTARILADGSAIVATSTMPVYRWFSQEFQLYVSNTNAPDSVNLAVNTLLSHNFWRDSLPIFLSSTDGEKSRFWLRAGHLEPQRYWVKNAANDSVSIWIGNPSKYELSLLLEDDVIIERHTRREFDQPIMTQRATALSLMRRTPIQELPTYWDILLENSISLNQNFMLNWARGGTPSISGMIDINGRARYTNPETRVQWTNTGRLRYGAIHTRERGTRTNADLLEFNSQVNQRMFSKIDFSASVNFRTQVARGFRSPTDNKVISKFLNPATFIAGLGVEYRPVEHTQITFSPLSYRNTFVLDTARINPTLHGIERHKRSRQEMGGQLQIRSRNRIMEGMTLNNSLRLFSSYLNNPENIDIDWESSLEKQLTWLLSVRLNLHIIYDDDIRFPVLNQAGQPYLLPDGSQKRVALPQINQFIGFTFTVRL